MRIAIDLLSEPKNGTGVSRYAKNLISGLSRIDRSNKYLILTNEENNDRFFVQADNFKYIIIKYTFGSRILRRLYECFLIPFMLMRGGNKVDVIHSVNNVIPFVFGMKKIVTVHDVAFALFPRLRFKGLKKIFYRIFTGSSIKAADRIIAVSERTKKDILSNYNIEAGKINVIPLGCDEFMEKVDHDKINEIKRKYGIQCRYVLTVGIIEPLKNMGASVRAFSEYLKTYNDRDMKLVIVGHKEKEYARMKELVRSLGIEDRVIFTGYVTENELKALYAGAELFLFLSLYEGFGLPVLEAMASGLPVIASNIDPIYSFASSQVLVDPNDLDGIASQMNRIITDERVKGTLMERARRQALEYSWENCAKQTLKVYETLHIQDAGAKGRALLID